jgi:hypothetical protein
MNINDADFNELSKTYDFLKNAPKYPTVSLFKYVRGKWFNDIPLTDSETQFIRDLTTMSKPELVNKAYVLGKWYDIEPKNIEYYNLVYRKQVQKCQFR